MIQSLLISTAVILRIISNPLGSVFQKQLINQGNDPLVINFLTYLVLCVPCFALAVNICWFSFPAEFWYYSILAGIFSAFGNGFLIKALQKGDISVLGPINAYKSLIGTLAGVFLLGEIPGVWGMLGTVLIIFGSYFILNTTQDRFSWKLLKKTEIQFRFFALVFTAIEAVFVKKSTLLSSITATSVSWCWFGIIFSFFFLIIYEISPKSEVKKLKFINLRKLLYLVLCAGVMLFTSVYALNHMPVAYALSLFQLSSIGSVVLGYLFFNEKDVHKKLLGALIMIAGSILIILYSNT